MDSRHYYGWSSVLATCSLAIVSMLSGACSGSPKVSLAISKKNQPATFQVSTRGVNGLLGIRIWRPETKELLWDVNLNYFPAGQIRYGEIPPEFRTFNGAKNAAMQNFPRGGAPPSAMPTNSTLLLSIECQYDSFLAPSARTFFFALTTDASGQIVSVERVDAPRPEEFPKTE